MKFIESLLLNLLVLAPFGLVACYVAINRIAATKTPLGDVGVSRLPHAARGAFESQSAMTFEPFESHSNFELSSPGLGANAGFSEDGSRAINPFAGSAACNTNGIPMASYSTDIHGHAFGSTSDTW